MGGSKVNISAATAAAAAHACCSFGVFVILLLLSAEGTLVQCRQCPPQSTPPAGLSEDFYAKSCPQVFSIVEEGVKKAMKTDVRITASLLRVSFHDCWIGGCDASLLLDNDTSRGFISEKFAGPNNASIRGFPVLDGIKAQLEESCPKTVSCADLVTIAARDSVKLAGGLPWPVVLGRRDSLTPHFDLANTTSPVKGLPSPFDTLENTTRNFKRRGFSFDEMVTLSGSHTFGRARCAVVAPVRFSDSFPFFLNDTNVTAPALKEQLLNNCPKGIDPNAVLNNLDQTTPDTFDNKYYTNLEKEFGILHTDQNLFSATGANKALVSLYGRDKELFLENFAKAMIKMQNLGPLTGTEGQIRIHCGKLNPSHSSSFSSESFIAVE